MTLLHKISFPNEIYMDISAEENVYRVLVYIVRGHYSS